MKEYTFSDLRPRVRTGQACTISGSGRNRVMGYRHGVLCGLGDIEESEWCRLVKELIEKSGEQELYQQILSYLTDHNYPQAPKSELKRKALELHAARIFDNQEWVNYIDFNVKYRPETLIGVQLVWVITSCCGKPGQVTQALLEKQQYNNTVCCPHCGKWSNFKIIADPDGGKSE